MHMLPDAFAHDLAKGAAILLLLPSAFACLVVAYKLVRVYLSDRSEYVRNRERTPSIRSVIRGEIPTFFDGIRDERVMAGLAINTIDNSWVEQGKLSEEAISSVLH
jgi:hypothetical protein